MWQEFEGDVMICGGIIGGEMDGSWRFTEILFMAPHTDFIF